MSDVKALEARVDALGAELYEARQKLRAAQIAECPAQVGDVVIYRGEEYRVCEHDPHSWSGKTWLRGNPKNADGSWSKRERNLYSDWELKK